MSAQALRCSASRCSLCSHCLLPRRFRACYSQYALSSIACRRQPTEAPTSAGPSRLTRVDSHHAVMKIRNPLDPARLDHYLASIGAAELDPTLDDVERYKPGGFSRPGSPRYATEYTNLLETLCRSFSKDQLRRFTELYKLDSIWTRLSRRKIEYAESIMEKAWGWPSLKEIERKRRDMTEVHVKSFTVTPSQLFLMMGKDGADLLQLSTQYNVHISLMLTPLALRVEGLRGSLKELTEYVSSLKKGIIEKIFELPTGRPIRPDLLQRISRLSGAYVENHGNRGKVRICAKDLRNITAAERLALRASLEVGTQAHIVCYDAPSATSDSPIEIPAPHKYSIYPFITPYSFPWTMFSGGAFRLRRVADWLGVDSYENIATTGGLTRNSRRLFNLDQIGEELSQLLCPTMPGSASFRRRIVTASLGHMLMSSGDNSQRATICPPLRGTSSLPHILKWLETSRTPLIFVPSVPPPVTTVTVGERRVLRRLVYKTLPQIAGQNSTPLQQVLRFEIELTGPSFTSTRQTQDFENAPKLQGIPPPDESGLSANPLSSQGNTPKPAYLEALNIARDPGCQLGRETFVDLMLPDRPMDVQFCIYDWDDVTLTQQPRVLQEYVDKLHDFLTEKAQLSQPLLHPDPPLTFSYEGRVYYLRDNLSLRQSNDLMFLSTISSDCCVDKAVEISNESIVDLHSSQKMELCQVKFDGTVEGQGWERFLAACDQLSIASLGSRCKDRPETGYLDN